MRKLPRILPLLAAALPSPPSPATPRPPRCSRAGVLAGGAAAATAFSAACGRQLFERPGRDWSCASATRTTRARRDGTRSPARILPLAPAINPQRFSDQARVEKWFRRNCRDVLERECTATEKGDLLTWLTLK
ncbi:MAG: DUF1924 domain-containing protein [Steroidobacteraceae bacterium]